MKTFTLFTIIVILILSIRMFPLQNDKLDLRPKHFFKERIIPNSFPDEQSRHTSESDTFNSKESRTIVNKTILENGFLLIEATYQDWDTLTSNWKYYWGETYQYDINNNLIEKIIKVWNENYSKHNYSYNNNNLVVEEKVYEWENNWVIDKQYFYSYDGINNLVEKLGQYWDGSEWIDLKKNIYNYDTNENLVEEVEQIWVGYWINSFRDAYSYDINQNLIEWLHQTWYLGSVAWGNDWIRTYLYNQNDKLTEELLLDWKWSDSIWVNDVLTYYSYDNLYNLIEKIYQVWNDVNWINSDMVSYEYDVNSYLILEVISLWRNSTWEYFYRIVYLYDGNYNLIESIWEDWDGINSYPFYRALYSYMPTGIEQLVGEVNTYSLLQNYPNPFNPFTTIKFSLPSSGYTTLIIYNALGEELAVLLDKELPIGTYEVEWNATGLPSGIYFYQLKTEGFVETNKMVLMK